MMKKLIMLVLALAMVAAFMPKAYAGDSAQLNLSVTFAADQDLKRVEELNIYIKDIYAKGKTIFSSIYQDRNEDGVVNGRDMDINGDGLIDAKDVDLIYQAIEQLKYVANELEPVFPELKDILARRPDLEQQITSVLATGGEVANKLYDSIAKLEDLLRQIPPPPVISIELNEAYWQLDAVRLGERRSNLNEGGFPIHMIKNAGNVTVGLDMGYGPWMAESQIRPGLEQGVNTFITLVSLLCRDSAENNRCEAVIPPEGRVGLGMLGTDEAAPLRLTYGAPTAFGDLNGDGKIGPEDGVWGMYASYEIRAYGKILVDPDPIPVPIPN